MDRNNDDVRTQIIEDSVNPIWYERKEIRLFYRDEQNAPPMILDVYDSDSIIQSDDILGRAVLYVIQIKCLTPFKLKDIDYKLDDLEDSKPQWHPLTMGDEENSGGEILVSVNLFSKNFKLPDKLSKEMRIYPETKLYEIDLNVLGLRNLVSSGILPVQKPYVKFDLSSMLPKYSQFGRISNLKTEPCKGGNNPTLKTLVKFNVELPLQRDLIPSLGVKSFFHFIQFYFSRHLCMIY